MIAPSRGPGRRALLGFLRCCKALSVEDACEGLVDDLVASGFELPSVYLVSGDRLRCQAARGYFQVVDGFAPGTGVIGRVVASGRSVRYDDVRGRPEFIAAVPGLLCEAAAPVFHGDDVVGVVNVESRSWLPPDTLPVLEAAAQLLGRRLTLLGGLPEQSPSERLAEAALHILAASEVVEIERRTALAATELSGMSSAAVVRDVDGQHEVTTSFGPLAEGFALLSHDELQLMASWVSAHTSSHFRGGHEVPPAYSFLDSAGLGAVSVHPLAVSGMITGLLLLGDRHPVAVPPAVVGSLEMLAGQAAAHLGMAVALREMRLRAELDELTGLGNRARFRSALQAALDGRDHGVEEVAVLLLDLDDFKLVNDSLGHHRGDELLVEVAARLRRALRDGDVACRLGGDEFILVLPHATQRAAVAVADRLRDVLSGTASVGYTDVAATASIGIALSSGRAESVDRMLQGADLAMYEAKARGKGGWVLFDPGMELAAAERLALEGDLRRALQDQQLTLAYQPLVDLASGTMTGVEALVRWTHDERGPVSPAEFIPVAEETGLILALGEFVLDEACAQLARWDVAGGDRDLKVAVNVSTRQLEHPGLLTSLDRHLATGLHPARLVLEVTETALVLDSGRVHETLNAIRNRGVHVAVDDFGTGYSSLARLRSAPVSRLKLDRSFVNEIQDGEWGCPLVDATLAMARGLGLGVVAEGVETVAQLHYLRNAGCGQAQGFLLARPMPPEAVTTILRGPAPWAELLDTGAGPGAPDSSRSAALIDLAVSSDADLDDLIGPLLNEILEMTGVSTAYLTRIDVAGNEQRVLSVATVPGTAQVVTAGMTVAWTDSVCSRALSAGPRRTGDAQAAFRDTDVPVRLGLRCFIVEPVLDPAGQLYGTLCAVTTERHTPTEADSATLRMMARLVTDKLRQHAPTGSRPPDTADDDPLRVEDPARVNRSLLASRRWAGAAKWETAHLQRLAERGAAPDQDVVWQAYVDRRNRLLHDPTDVAGRRVVIADDDPVTRAAVTSQLHAHGLHAVAEAPSGATAIGTTIAEQPDVLVVEYELGDMTAEQVIKAIRTFAPGTRILLHSARADVHLLAQRLDVDRAVHKEDGGSHLQEALSALAG